MKWIIHKLRRSNNAKPWIAYSVHLASSFATFEEAMDYADQHPIVEATS